MLNHINHIYVHYAISIFISRKKNKNSASKTETTKIDKNLMTKYIFVQIEKICKYIVITT